MLGVLLSNMYSCAFCACISRKMVSYPLMLELQTVISCYVGAEKQNAVSLQEQHMLLITELSITLAPYLIL